MTQSASSLTVTKDWTTGLYHLYFDGEHIESTSSVTMIMNTVRQTLVVGICPRSHILFVYNKYRPQIPCNYEHGPEAA